MSGAYVAAGRRVLIFGIHNTVDWWTCLGNNMGWDAAPVVTDLRGEGQWSTVDDFYAGLRRRQRRPEPGFGLLSEQQKQDVVARCRTLRWLAPELAHAMVESMAEALERVLDRSSPRLVLSFPIDRYVKHVLKLLAERRGVPYVELTASVVPSMSMLLRDGQLVRLARPVAPELVDHHVSELATPNFTPSYVPRKATYTRMRFVRTLGYFRARALAMKVIAVAKRDPLNLHYLDAQPMLGHKCRWKDIRIVGMCDPEWRRKVGAAPRGKRVLFGLQLFPEASIDYWIANPALIDHENLVVRAAEAFSREGFVVMVKDHPLQFGFRQTELIDRLRALPGVVVVPYDVSGNELLSFAGSNFTFTGTMGLQAALQGLPSIATDCYYSNDVDFILVRQPEDLDRLPQKVQAALAEPMSREALDARRRRIIGALLQGSFTGDFFSFKGYTLEAPTPGAKSLGQALGTHLDTLIHQGTL